MKCAERKGRKLTRDPNDELFKFLLLRYPPSSVCCVLCVVRRCVVHVSCVVSCTVTVVSRLYALSLHISRYCHHK